MTPREAAPGGGASWLRRLRLTAGRWLTTAAKAIGRPWPGPRYAYDTPARGGPWWDSYNRRRGAAPADGNSIVVAVVGWVARTFPEAPLRVWDRQPTGDEVVFDHPLALLVEQPNPEYGGPVLWMATIIDFLVTGNAYWLKVRNGRGRLEELWWLPSVFLEPRWETDEGYVDYYDYSPQGEARRLPREDVVHLRYGLDPENPRKGKSPVASVLREVLTDEEAQAYTQTILKNLGVPGVIISPEDDLYASDEELEAIKRRYIDRFTGAHRGEPLVLTRKTHVQLLSFSPEQLNLRDLRKIPEERISAVFGTPAVVVGLGAGLDRSTFANFAEAREAAYESLIIPMQRLLAADVQTQLLPDFGGASVSRRQRCGFDTSNVRVLQEDQDKLVARLVQGVEGALMTPNEARAKLGLPPAEDGQGDQRLVKATLVSLSNAPAPSGQQAAPALPAPAEAAAGQPDRADGAVPAGEPVDEALKELPARFAGWMNGTAVGRES